MTIRNRVQVSGAGTSKLLDAVTIIVIGAIVRRISLTLFLFLSFGGWQQVTSVSAFPFGGFLAGLANRWTHYSVAGLPYFGLFFELRSQVVPLWEAGHTRCEKRGSNDNDGIVTIYQKSVYGEERHRAKNSPKSTV